VEYSGTAMCDRKDVLYLNLTVVTEKGNGLVLHEYMLEAGAVSMHIQLHIIMHGFLTTSLGSSQFHRVSSSSA